MLRRTTKTTSLLMVMASIITIMPAKAADILKIEAQEGTIYNGYAKGPGMLIDAEIGGKEEALYYVSIDGEMHNIDSDESWDSAYSGQLYVNNKYVGITDDKFIALQDNYKVIDEKIADNANDDADLALRKSLKKDDDGRLNEDEYDGTNGIITAKGRPSTYNPYSYKLKNERINGTPTTTIYADGNGNYVDADYNIGSLKINTTGGSVTIKNTEDTYEVKDGSTTYEYKAEIKDRLYLNENDYVYRLVDLYIFKKEKGASDSSYTDVTGEITFGGSKYLAPNLKNDSNGNKYVTVFQKFSIAQASDNIDGLKYSKDSSLYFLADEDGKQENVLAFPGFNGKTGGTTRFACNATLGLTSAWSDDVNKKVYCETLTPKSRNGYNYLDLSDSDNLEFDSWNNNAGQSWILSKGYIETWDPKQEAFVKLYKVDGGMNKMYAGSKDNIVVWNEDDEIYSIIENGNSASKTTTTATSSSSVTENIAKGWVRESDGTWSYNKADGTKATGWLQDGAWYYLNTNGVMVNGWINEKGTWYYLNTTGAMQTGWINDNGTWYYCNTSGAMLANTVVDGYELGANGAWIK